MAKWYNITYHMSTKLTPFEALYDYPPPKLANYISHTTQSEAVENERSNSKTSQA